MKKRVILLFLIILLIPFASAEGFSKYSSLDFKFNLNVLIDLIPTNSNPELESFIANVTLFPRTYSLQEVTDLTTNSNPLAKTTKSEDSINFEWNSFNEQLEIDLESYVTTKNSPAQIPSIPFPITQDLPENIKIYTKNTKNIDINEPIIQQANSIVSGETDLFTAVFKLAEWTNENINYDLNSFTETAAQKSSWVLENKEGVCDEITSLFISMCRSVGIPAKFVAGTSYASLQSSFGNHGWAEVYFPNYGWVPFDVTFGEYGYLNPSHLKLSETLDSADYSINYKWVQENIEADIKPISISSELIQKGNQITSPFSLNLKPLVTKVGPGSYVPFEISVKNPYDKYTSTIVIVTIAPGLTEERNYKSVLLKPNEEKKVYFIANITENVPNNYIFTTQLGAEEFFGASASETFQYSTSFDTFTYQEAVNLIDSLTQEEEKSYSPNLLMDCKTSKNYYYNYETPEINCILKNTGNNLLEDLKVCLVNDCQILDLRIAQETTISFTPNKENKTVIIIAENDKINLQKTLDLKIFEKPDLKIQSTSYPESIDYKDNFNFTFILSSEVLVKNLIIQINDFKPTTIAESQGAKTISTDLEAKYFASEPIKIKIDYEDENANKFSLQEEYNPEIKNMPWYIKIVNFFKNIFK